MHDILRTQFQKMESNKRKNDGASGGEVVDKKGVIRHGNGLPIHGGTTGTIVVLKRTPKGQKLVTAYVGDSEAVLIRKVEKASEFGPKYIVLTEAHRALNPKENYRVHALPEKDFPIKLLFVYDVDGVRDANLLPKVYLQNGNINTNITENPMSYGLYPSNIRQEPATYVVSPRARDVDRVRLANTRALGDFYAHPYGLSAVPDVSFQNLPSDMILAFCVASDGVWDIWEYGDVVKWFYKCLSSDPTCKKLEGHVKVFLNETKKRAASLFGNEASVDDSSLAIVFVPKVPDN